MALAMQQYRFTVLSSAETGANAVFQLLLGYNIVFSTGFIYMRAMAVLL